MWSIEKVIGGVVITLVDITRLTAAEARIGELTTDLRNRVQSLETLLDLLPVGVFLHEDDPGIPVRGNRYAAGLLGESPAATATVPRPISAGLRIFDGDRELAADEQPLQRASRRGETVPAIEGRLMRPDGSRIDVLVSATPLFAEDGRVRGGIATMLDISGRKRAAATHQQFFVREL